MRGDRGAHHRHSREPVAGSGWLTAGKEALVTCARQEGFNLNQMSRAASQASREDRLRSAPPLPAAASPAAARRRPGHGAMLQPTNVNSCGFHERSGSRSSVHVAAAEQGGRARGDGRTGRLRGSRRGSQHGLYLPRRDSEGRKQSHPWNFKPLSASKALWPAKKPGKTGCLRMPQCKLTCAHVGSEEAQLLWGLGVARGAAAPGTPTPCGCSSTE